MSVVHRPPSTARHRIHPPPPQKNELLHGRLAMLGFFAALVNEASTGLGPIGQVGRGAHGRQRAVAVASCTHMHGGGAHVAWIAPNTPLCSCVMQKLLEWGMP